MGVSETTYYDMLRAWKRARLDRGQGLLDYPAINILHYEHGIGGEPDDEIDPDVDAFQRAVDRLPRSLRDTYEAFHLGIIRGEFCRKMPHKARWLILGISGQDYKDRERSARRAIADDLLMYFGKRPQ